MPLANIPPQLLQNPTQSPHNPSWPLVLPSLFVRIPTLDWLPLLRISRLRTLFRQSQGTSQTVRKINHAHAPKFLYIPKQNTLSSTFQGRSYEVAPPIIQMLNCAPKFTSYVELILEIYSVVKSSLPPSIIWPQENIESEFASRH